MDRPVTSKSRGVCRYYNTSRGCYAGDNCKFIHGQAERLTPYDKSKTCKFFAKGFCRHGDKCWFMHAAPQSPSPEDESMEDACCICLEKPSTYGLLIGCSHVFCLECIRQWRDPSGKSGDVVTSGNTKRCPLCRASSTFITPSHLFYPQGHTEKIAAIENYKSSMARIPCKYFEETKSTRPLCPFGRDCFYRHQNDDGTPFNFPAGVTYSMKMWKRRLHRTTFSLGSANPLSILSRILDNPFEDFSATIDALRASLPLIAEQDGLWYGHGGDTDDGEDDADDEAELTHPGDVNRMDTIERLADSMLLSVAAWPSTELNAARNRERGEERVESDVGDEMPPLERLDSGSRGAVTPPALFPTTASSIPTSASTSLLHSGSRSPTGWHVGEPDAFRAHSAPSSPPPMSPLRRAFDLDFRVSSGTDRSAPAEAEPRRSTESLPNVQTPSRFSTVVGRRGDMVIDVSDDDGDEEEDEDDDESEGDEDVNSDADSRERLERLLARAEANDTVIANSMPETSEPDRQRLSQMDEETVDRMTERVLAESDRALTRSEAALTRSDRIVAESDRLVAEAYRIIAEANRSMAQAARTMAQSHSLFAQSDEVAASPEVERALAEADESETVSSDETACPLVHDVDPPFVTDGRGRVVWSSTRPGRGAQGETHSTRTSTPSQRRASGSDRHVKSRRPGREALSSPVPVEASTVAPASTPTQPSPAPVPGASSGGGFMTDGRGRVIWTGEGNGGQLNDGSQPQMVNTDDGAQAGSEAVPGQQRSFFGRVYDVVFPA